MGTKVQCESYYPGYLQMRDITDDANSCSWPQYYGEKPFANGQYCNGVLPKATTETYPGFDKDSIKRTMLEHEATFKHQLYELHRLYRIQRELMDEVKRKELHKIRMQVEASMPSSPSASHVTSEDARKRYIPGFPPGNSVCNRPSMPATENINSPLSSVKGSSTYASPMPFQNGSTSKGVEILESRPNKARRKMFDLRLPAEEYIDTEEAGPLRSHNVSGNVQQHRNLNNAMKNGFSQGDVSLVRGKTSVADLNEPIPMEEANPSEHGKIRGNELDRGSDKLHLARREFQNNGSGNQWLKPICEESLPSSSRSMQKALFNRAPNPPIVDQTRRNGLGLDLTERSIDSFNSSCHREAVIGAYPFAPDPSKSWSHSALSWEKPNGILSQNSVVHSRLNSSATWSKSSQSSTQSNGKFVDRWSHNPISTSNQKFGSEMVNRNGYHNGFSTGLNGLQFSVPPGSYGQLNRGTAAQENLTNQSSVKFCHGPSYVDLIKPVRGVNLNAAISNGSTNKMGSRHGIEVIDLERKDDSNLSSLPWLRARSASQNEVTSTEIDLNARRLSFLQSSNRLAWHGEKSASHSTNPDATRNNKEIDGSRKILGFPVFQSAHVPNKEQASEVEVENKAKHHILFDMNMPCDDNGDVELVGNEKTAKVSNFRCEIDLNYCVSEDEASLLPCASDFKKKAFTGIDLEAPLDPEIEGDAAFPVGECISNVHQEAEIPLDELTKVAAEAIVAISSSAPQTRVEEGGIGGASCSLAEEVSVPDPLQWFAEVVSSCGDYLESRFKALSRARGDSGIDNASSTYEVFDYFESMTLKLTETAEEDYMPKPLVPESLNLYEEMGTTSVLPVTRARRGNARRGRQKRDFQRDILPGLVTLSRHEVTEDIQTFGGLMRATGHLTWQSGLARRSSGRNGCGRGRRRSAISPPPPPIVDLSPQTPNCTPLIQQLNTVEVGMEDRSLRSWGKTTRRPRRQRCPSGNVPTLPVT
ncbi:hypothetical protein LINPERPRIM_LOCUS32025 [Linum perenne]